MSLLERIRRSRASLSEEIGEGRYEDFSALNASRFRHTRRCIAAHAAGRVLDVGCGHMPFRSDVLLHAETYEGFDVERRTEGVEHVGDVQDMEGIPDEAYDTVLCLEVLEHVPRPDRAVRELTRVLRPGGRLILSVPHLSRLHEEPSDFYRYTRYGVRRLLACADLDEVEIAAHAGLFSFLAHQASTVLLGLAWPVPGLRQVAYGLNRLLLVRPPLWLDARLDASGLFAAGYLAVGFKPAPEG